MAYRERMSRRIVKTVDVPVRGLFVPPTVIRLDDMEELDAEWFGPIIHVAMWKAGTLIETVERVNAKRFGLTMGLHSRIRSEEHTSEFKSLMRISYAVFCL